MHFNWIIKIIFPSHTEPGWKSRMWLQSRGLPTPTLYLTELIFVSLNPNKYKIFHIAAIFYFNLVEVCVIICYFIYFKSHINVKSYFCY